MTPESLNPSSIRFDFMKWVSLHNKDVAIVESFDLLEGNLFYFDDDTDEVHEHDWWS